MSTSGQADTVKCARKPHRCSWCYERIEKGYSYIRWPYYDEGTVVTVKVHPECFDAMNKCRADCGTSEFMPGEHQRGECQC